jgi:outer membrane protein assembly factor BamB
MPSSRNERGGRAILWTALALLVIFVGLLLYQKYIGNRVRYSTNPGLLAELADVEFVEDESKEVTREWPGWLGPGRDGVAHEPELLLDWPARGPRTVWVMETEPEPGLKLEGGFSSFAVGDGRVYTMFGDESQEVVACLDADSGKLVWHDAYAIHQAPQYPGPRATPTLADGRLYTVGSEGQFHCYDAAGGKLLWEHDLPGEFQASSPKWGFACSPLVLDDLVYVVPGGAGQSVVACDRETGEVRWKAGDQSAGYSSPIHLRAGGVDQVVVFTARAVAGLEAKGGQLLWQFPWPTPNDVNAATPLVFHARKGEETLTYVFISSGYDTGCALLKLEGDAEKGFQAKSVYVSNELECHFSTPVRYQDHLYGLDERRQLTCLSLRTGKAKWRQQGFQKGTLIRVDDHLLVLGARGNLALVEVTPNEYRALVLVAAIGNGFSADGQAWGAAGMTLQATENVYREVASARVLRSLRCWTVPALADGRLFVRYEDQVKCLELRKGREGGK